MEIIQSGKQVIKPVRIFQGKEFGYDIFISIKIVECSLQADILLPVFAESDIDEGAKLLDKMASSSLHDDPQFIEEYNRVLPTLQHDKLFSESLKDRTTVMGFVMDTDTIKGSLPKSIAKLDKKTLKNLAINKPTGYTANLKVLQDSAYSGGFFDNPLPFEKVATSPNKNRA